MFEYRVFYAFSGLKPTWYLVDLFQFWNYLKLAFIAWVPSLCLERADSHSARDQTKLHLQTRTLSIRRVICGSSREKQIRLKWHRFNVFEPLFSRDTYYKHCVIYISIFKCIITNIPLVVRDVLLIVVYCRCMRTKLQGTHNSMMCHSLMLLSQTFWLCSPHNR